MKTLLFLTAVLSTVLLCSFDYQKNERRRPVAGERVTYSYTNESIGHNDIKSLFTTDTNQVKKPFSTRLSLQKTCVSINCRITATVIQVFKDSELLVFQITDPAISISNNGAFVNTDVFTKEMCTPFFAVRTINGKIGAIRSDSSISLFSASIVKGIISRLQFVVPSRNARGWNIKEVNSTGEFLAGYHFMNNNKGVYEFEKTNNGYTSKSSSNSRRQRLITGGKSVIQTDASYAIRQENGSETLTTLVGDDTISMSGTQINIKCIAASKAGEKALNSFNRLLTSSRYKRVSTLSAKLTDSEIGKLAYAHTLGKDNLASLAQKLKSLSNADHEAIENLVMKFRALAAMYPEECKKMGQLIEREPCGTLKFEILGNALSRTKTSTATDVLAELITVRRNEKEILIEFLPVLATTRHPTENAANIVRSLAFNNNGDPGIKLMAQMTLGGIAHNLAPVNARKSESLCSFLFEKMHAEPDTLQKLLVLGNTGSPSIMPLVKSYLNSSSGQVRMYSLKAMRLVPGIQATSILNNMRASKDSLLRATAIETLKFREQYASN